MTSVISPFSWWSVWAEKGSCDLASGERGDKKVFPKARSTASTPDGAVGEKKLMTLQYGRMTEERKVYLDFVRGARQL